MREKKPVRFILIFSSVVLFITLLMQGVEIWYGGDIAFLYPRGIIGLKERNLLFLVQILMLLVVIPVYILTFFFSWKYRAHSKESRYEPEWDDHPIAEVIWWGLPFVLVVIVSFLTWYQCHALDPFKPIESDQKPLTIQVVALQWKWLFIYPEEQIATVNFVQFPEKQPLRFEITADAPMNSFWIPHLGGQIYAMPKMKTELYLISDTVGEFRGCSANLSGEGFSGMHFIAKASDRLGYEQWVESIKKASSSLNLEEYNRLALPSKDNPVAQYRLAEEKLFEHVLMKYMHPVESK